MLNPFPSNLKYKCVFYDSIFIYLFGIFGKPIVTKLEASTLNIKHFKSKVISKRHDTIVKNMIKLKEKCIKYQ